VIYFALQELIYETFGIVQAGILEDLQVRLYNADTRLAVIKTSRDSADIVRAAITLLNQLNDEPIVASVISIHGSARTLKLSCIQLLRKTFSPSEQLHKLEEQIEQIRVIE
jgi:RNase P/RNase MRP subunit POP5